MHFPVKIKIINEKDDCKVAVKKSNMLPEQGVHIAIQKAKGT